MKKKSDQTQNSKLMKLGFLLIVIVLIVTFIQNLRSSLFFNHPNRLNIIIYTKSPIFYSFGFADNVDYKATFDSNISIVVPGGYGRYQIKNLGNLSRLEKKPQILTQSFSSLGSLYLNNYFYNVKADSTDFSNVDIFKYKSNASFLDRLFIYLTLSNKNKNDFSLIHFDYGGGEDTPEDFYMRKYQGYFYQKNLRDENKNVQIIFHSRPAVDTMSRIIEGEGIRVVDLEYEDTQQKGCIIITNTPAVETLKFLKSHFHCTVKKGDTGGQDMIINFGEEIESEWE